MKKGLTDLANIMIGSTQVTKVMRGATLIWELITGWTPPYISAYTSRVEVDYGYVEDAVVLEADLNLGTEQEYLDTIAIYNPNGGYKTGKIHDVRDTGTGNNNLFASDNFEAAHWNRLTYVTITYGELDYQNRPLASKITRVATGLIVTEENVSVELNKDHIFSLQIKKGNLRYVTLNHYLMVSDDRKATFDLDTGTIVSSDAITSFIDVLGNGWYRIGYKFNPVTDNTGHFEILVSSTSTGNSSVNGDFAYISKAQLVQQSVFEEAPRKPGFDLAVTGGGGTRINSLGGAEGLGYNHLVNSYNLIGDAGWTLDRGVTMTLDQVGITGKPNTAFTLTDPTTSDYAQLKKSLMSFTSAQVKVSVWILKDNDETRFPEIYVAFRRQSDAVIETLLVELNTKTGAIYFRVPTGYDDLPYQLIDRGLWWELACTTLSDTDRLVDLLIRPSITTTPGGATELTATGSIVVGHVGVYTGNIKLVSNPITTNGAASTALPKIDHGTGESTFLVEPTRTNNVSYSYNFSSSGNTGTTDSEYPTRTLSEVGITGKPNTATLLEDTSTTVSQNLWFSTGSSTANLGFIWIKKDTNEARFPCVRFRKSGGGAWNTYNVLNTKTGELLSGGSTVIDRGDWWEVRHDFTSGLATIYIYIYPAYTTNSITGANEVTATGSVTVGYMHISSTNSKTETPIITNGSAVTITNNLFRYDYPSIKVRDVSVYYEGSISKYGLIFSAVGDNNAWTMVEENSDGYIQANFPTDTSGKINSKSVAKNNHKVVLVVGNSINRLKLYIDGIYINEVYKMTRAIGSFGNYDVDITTRMGFGRFKEIKLYGLLTEQQAIDMTAVDWQAETIEFLTHPDVNIPNDSTIIYSGTPYQTTGAVIWQAVEDFIVREKVGRRWLKFTSVKPKIGTTPQSQAVNLMRTDILLSEYFGPWVTDGAGSKGNGIDTYIKTNTVFEENGNSGMTIVLNQFTYEPSKTTTSFGCFQGGFDTWFHLGESNSGQTVEGDGSLGFRDWGTTVPQSTRIGVKTYMNSDSKIKFFSKGATTYQQETVEGNNQPQGIMYEGASDHFNTIQYFLNGTLGTSIMHRGLTDAEAIALNLSLETFENDLKRKTW